MFKKTNIYRCNQICNTVEDTEGCVLPVGHLGPHKFVTQSGRVFTWEYNVKKSCDVFSEQRPSQKVTESKRFL